MRIYDGVARYRQNARPRYRELFLKLSEGQSPHTMFVTCADSRILPNLITDTEPGELFVLRNIGNVIPPPGADIIPSEGAALEYAVGVLGVEDVIVCGHSHCGAIGALVRGRIPGELGTLARWLREVRELSDSPTYSGNEKSDALVDRVARENVLRQLSHLREYPFLAEAERGGRLRVHAWFFDIARGEIETWDEGAGAFVAPEPTADG